nr:quinoprotein amine dehydrogenase, beta chain-like protein [Tanacetum cinerariifolium]
MSSSSSTSNWIRSIPTKCFCDLPVVERTSRTPANPARRFLCWPKHSESGSQCRFYHFLDPEIRYGYYRNEMHNLYIQLQQARREMQVQEYTHRSRIHDLKLIQNERSLTSDCYKKAVVVFIIMVFVMCFLTN